MAEHWQDVLKRAQATFPVWEVHFGALELGGTGLNDFQDLMNALPEVAQARDTAVQAVDEVRQTRDFAVQEARVLVLKMPKIIEGVIDAESGLLDDLDKVYAIVPWSSDKVISRGQLLAPVWASANTWQLGRTPPRAVVVRGTVTQALFVAKIAALPGLEANVKAVEHALAEARGDLRRAVAVLDRLNKRFYLAATGLTDPGTPAADALATIPTETDSDLPETLGIRRFTQGGTGGLQLLVAYEPYHEEDVTAKVLQWQVLDEDAGWDHEVAVDPSGNALGPFEMGQTVRVRTKVTNAHGSRDGGPRQLTLLAPPE